MSAWWDLIIASGVVTCTARRYSAAPFSHFALIPCPISRVLGHGAFVSSRTGGVFAIGSLGIAVDARRAPSLCISGITFTYPREFLQIELANYRTIMRPGGCTAHCRIVRIVCSSDGRHHRSNDCCADKQIDPHRYSLATHSLA